jgi:arylsulfatase
VLELSGLPSPRRVNGVDQKPLEGFSFAATFTNADATTGRRIQYYEMLGCRALWQEGWMAVTWHKPGTDWEQDQWELYHQDHDFAQSRDLAGEHPARLAQMVELWWHEAQRHQVLPLDDRFRERVADPTRPSASLPASVYRYFPGTSPVPNQALPKTLNCRHSFTARLTLADRNQQGFLVGQGSDLSGWMLVVEEGHGVYVNNCVKLHVTRVRTAHPLPLGREVSLAVEYEPLGVGLANVTLRVDGEVAACAERVPTAPMGLSNVTEGLQVGRCWSRPIVAGAFEGDFAFEGSLREIALRTDLQSLIRRTDYRDPGDAGG